MEKFTRELCDLYVNKNVPLEECLRLMANKPYGSVKKAALHIYSSIGNGDLFSNSLRTCPNINFDDVYINFVLLAEKSGNLRTTIQYLDKRCQRFRENREKLIGSVLYPVFVIFISFIACIFLDSLIGVSDGNSIYKFFALLICICALSFFVMYRLLCTNKLYEAFLGADLLIKEGISASVALTCGAIIVGLETKIGKAFIDASRKIEYGMSFQTAFNLDEKIKEAFYYADSLGGGNDIFEKVANWIRDKDEKRRFICLQLIEPIFIAITGSFLLILVLNYLMPVINNFEWV